MRKLAAVVASISLACGLAFFALSAFSQTKTAQTVNAIAANPEYKDGARMLYTGAVVTIRELSATDRRLIKAELLDQHRRVYDQVSNKTALDLFGYSMFISEVNRGDYSYAHDWLKQTHWDAFNDVLVEVVLARGISRCDPLTGIRVLLSLAWDIDSATRDYARFVLHRAFFDLVRAEPNAKTLDDSSVDTLETLLLDRPVIWTLDPTYTERWEQASLEGKPPGHLFETPRD